MRFDAAQMRKSLKDFNPQKDIHQGGQQQILSLSGRTNKTPPRTQQEEAISSSNNNNQTFDNYCFDSINNGGTTTE